MQKNAATLALITLAASCGLACSSSDDDTSAEPTPVGDVVRDDTMTTMIEAREELDLEPPERGFQLETIGMTIEPGEDIEYCEIVQLPGGPDDVYWVNRTEVQMTAHSHHLIVDAVNPESDVNADLEIGDIQLCTGAMELVGFANLEMIGGSQTTYNNRVFHDGIGQRFYGGQKVIFDYHYLNTSEEPIPAKHRMNFYEVDQSDIDHIGQSMAFANLTIDTPPGTEKSFIGECRFTSDVMIGSVIRHTHAWGRDFDVWFAGGSRDGEHIWQSTDYELDTEFRFSDPIAMPAGTGFRFQCDFENTTDDNLVFGLKASDEMCILFGSWWDPVELEPAEPQFCAMLEIDEDGVARRGEITPEMIQRFRDQGGIAGN